MLEFMPRAIEESDLPAQRTIGYFAAAVRTETRPGLAVFVPKRQRDGTLVAAVPGQVESAAPYKHKGAISPGIVTVSPADSIKYGFMSHLDANNATLVPLDVVASLLNDSDNRNRWFASAQWNRADRQANYLELLGVAYETLFDEARAMDPTSGLRHQSTVEGNDAVILGNGTKIA